MTSCKESPMGQKLFAQKSGHEPNLWEFRTWETRELNDNILITWHQSRRRCLNNVLMQTCICMIDICTLYQPISTNRSHCQTVFVFVPRGPEGYNRELREGRHSWTQSAPAIHLNAAMQIWKHQKININRYFTWIAHYMHLISRIY